MEQAKIMEPATLYPAIALVSLVTVEFGGWSLLRLINKQGILNEFQEQFFRAGHGHAGVLLVLSLVYFVYLDRTAYSVGVQWALGALLLAGVLAQSGGFFLHMLKGGRGRSSAGTIVTSIGGLALAVALIALALGLVL